MTTAFNPLNIGALPGDGTGEIPRAGFTKIKADLAAIQAALGRRPNTPGTFGTTTSSGSTTVLNDTSQTWAVNQFAGQTCTLTNGTAAGYSSVITSNTATSITVTTAFPITVGTGQGYLVSPAALTLGSEGFATAAGSTAPSTLVDTAQAWTVNQWVGQYLTCLGGAYAGQPIPIASNTSTTLTLSYALGSVLAAGTPYVIGSGPLINADPIAVSFFGGV